MGAFRAEFHCLEGCAEGRASLTEVVYRCPACGGLLEVVHDLEALSTVEAEDWRRRFETRLTSAVPWERSGVWARREWVHPHLEDEDLVTLGEGSTPLVPSEILAKRHGLGQLWVKQCGTSHTGSFKDLGMTVLVSAVKAMRRQGVPLRAVACASTGDTSAALAAYAAAARIPAVVFLPAGKVTTAQLLQPLAHGARVLSLDTDFDGCMKIVQAVTERQDAGIYLANSMNSLRVEGQKTVAFEIVQQLGGRVPSWVVIPGGNLGNVSALVAGFSLMRSLGLIDRLPRVCVAQAEAANPLYLASQRNWEFEAVTARETAASAIRIGNPVSFSKAVRALKEANGLVRQASEAALSEAAAQGDRAGLFLDPHTGVALAAVIELRREKILGPEDEVVVVSTAHALKFSEHKSAYHESRLPHGASLEPNRPVELPATVDAVRGALDRLL